MGSWGSLFLNPPHVSSLNANDVWVWCSNPHVWWFSPRFGWWNWRSHTKPTCVMFESTIFGGKSYDSPRTQPSPSWPPSWLRMNAWRVSGSRSGHFNGDITGNQWWSMMILAVWCSVSITGAMCRPCATILVANLFSALDCWCGLDTWNILESTP